MMQFSNRVIVSILLALPVNLWPSSSVVYGRSEDSVSLETFGQFFTGDGFAAESDAPEEQSTGGPHKRPNVLLIGIETLRADHVGHLGYARDTTPTLDVIAKEGVVFSKTIATASWTIPTVMSVFTSLYPEIHGTTNYDKKLPESVPTLAEILRENGYKTVAFVSNPALDGRHGYSRGFELYDDFSVWFDFVGMGKYVAGDNTFPNPEIRQIQTSEPLTRSTLNWLKRNYQEPFFMFVFYFDPHHDYTPPPPFDTMFDPNYDGSIDGRGIVEEPRKSIRPPQRDLDHIIALYDGEIRYTDKYISKLLDAFTKFGILDQTLVVIFGDHGEEFYEHGSTAHGHTLYNELIHIPLVFRWPSGIPKSRHIDALVSQVDIMPTIFDYLGIRHQPAIQGRSLKDLIEGHVSWINEYVFAGVSNGKCAIIGNRNKMLLSHGIGGKEFYDLSNDPREQHNIYQTLDSSALVLSFERRWKEWSSGSIKLLARFPRDSDSDQIQLNERRLKQLKALGYVH